MGAYLGICIFFTTRKIKASCWNIGDVSVFVPIPVMSRREGERDRKGEGERRMKATEEG